MIRKYLPAAVPVLLVLAVLAAMVQSCANLQAVNPCSTAQLPEEFGFCSTRAGTTLVNKMTNLATKPTTPASVSSALNQVVPPLVDALDDLSDATQVVGSTRKQVAAGETPEDELVIALQILANAQRLADERVAAVNDAAKGDSP